MGAIVLLLLVSGFIQDNPFAAPDATPPQISVWYGSHQTFGTQGVPQRFVNIVGNVADAESGLAKLTYTLDGGPVHTLRIGPDARRLVKPGDFNAEIDINGLKEGDNQVTLTALNNAGLSSTSVVTLTFHRNTWALPYTIDWSKVTDAQDVLQIVDGKWSWDSSGIRPAEVGYDRVLAVGDMSWTDYEATIPITVHGINPNAYDASQGGGAGFGIMLRWLGHTDNPVVCREPSCGWNPNGVSDWYSFKKTGIDILSLEASPPSGQASLNTLKIHPGETYVFRVQVETTAAGNEYRFKLWQPSVQSEPSGWTLERTATPGDDTTGNLTHGSLLLVAHNVDLTFGNLNVNPLPAKASEVSPQQLFVPMVLH